MMEKTAILIGGTGLVGGALLRQLLADAAYGQVVSLGRRKTGLAHAKLVEHVVDFGKPDSWASLVQGDVLFSALGTTRGQAGSVAAQRVVDYDYQYAAAKAAAANGVPTYILCSSVGANARSSSGYMKMKGELDRDVALLPFRAVHILRPGPLVGERERPRTGEGLLIGPLRFFNALGLFTQYRPIEGQEVAKVMLKVADLPAQPARIHEPKDIFALLEG